MDYKEAIAIATANADIINKVGIAGSAVLTTLIAVIVGALVQLYIAHRTRQSQAEMIKEQLAIQEVVSRRAAAATIASKRQAWIDELRSDIASFITHSREAHSEWLNFETKYPSVLDNLAAPLSAEVYKAASDAASKVGESNMKALEVQIRMEIKLNPDEPRHKDFIRHTRLISNYANSRDENIGKPTRPRADKMAELIRDAIPLARQLIKVEWEQLKSETYVDPKSSLQHRDPRQ